METQKQNGNPEWINNMKKEEGTEDETKVANNWIYWEPYSRKYQIGKRQPYMDSGLKNSRPLTNDWLCHWVGADKKQAYSTGWWKGNLC